MLTGCAGTVCGHKCRPEARCRSPLSSVRAGESLERRGRRSAPPRSRTKLHGYPPLGGERRRRRDGWRPSARGDVRKRPKCLLTSYAFDSPNSALCKSTPLPWARAGRLGCPGNGPANGTRGCGTHSLSQPRAPPTRPLGSKRQAGARVRPPVISRGARNPARGLSGSSPVCPGRGACRALWWIMRNPPLGLRPRVEPVVRCAAKVLRPDGHPQARAARALFKSRVLEI